MKTAKNRKSWLYLILVLIILAFVGVSMLPLLSVFLKDNSQPRFAQSKSATVERLSSSQKQELESRAEGYELVLQREPENTSALRGLVEVRLEQGNLESALNPLEKLARLSPQQPDYAVLLAEGKQQIGDLDGAIAAYDSILATDPGNIRALDNLIELQLQQNQGDNAIARLQDTLKIAAQDNLANPNPIDTISIQLLLGKVYARQDRLTEAIAVYDQAIETETQDFRPFFAKALVLEQQGNLNAAKPLLSKAASLAPPKYKDRIQQRLDELSTSEDSATPEAVESGT
ncbi:MAG: tetratricopeptide repeat protein [Jaaginema sp. PMC 1079.18]|nr:tetratricopeptide repeat protein [Jaaginema sp. PMC 1080.18]MEC4849492.1 tetratricopeptide repeat protein [Jaaginema sp. PMC 1079.18]MEC4866005.1 tetratricopeptide repeat protein [Jaaginema sp. PMC 1078.18]